MMAGLSASVIGRTASAMQNLTGADTASPGAAEAPMSTRGASPRRSMLQVQQEAAAEDFGGGATRRGSGGVLAKPRAYRRMYSGRSLE